MNKLTKVGLSILPLFILMILTPFAFFGIWLLEDIMWQVVWATVWMWGGVYMATWFHVKILLGDKKI